MSTIMLETRRKIGFGAMALTGLLISATTMIWQVSEKEDTVWGVENAQLSNFKLKIKFK